MINIGEKPVGSIKIGEKPLLQKYIGTRELLGAVSSIPFFSPVATGASYASKIKDTFGFDRVIEGYAGNAVKLIKAPYVSPADEADFGYDSEGRLDITSIHAWRGSSDVKVVLLYSQKVTGYTLFAEGDVFFIKNDQPNYHCMGTDYEYAVGDNGFKGNNVLNGKGAYCATLEGGGHLRTGAMTFDASAGFNMFTLFSPLRTKVKSNDAVEVLAVDVTTTSGSNTVTVADTSSMQVGFWLHGGTSNIQEFSQIETIVNGTTLELTQDCRATGTVEVDFLEFNHETNSDQEYIAQYALGSSLRFETQFTNSSSGGAITRCYPASSGGEVQFIGNEFKALTPRVLHMRLGLDDYGSCILNHRQEVEAFSPAVRTDVEGGSFDDGQVVIGSEMTSNSDVTAISTSNRAHMKFSAVVITDPLTSEEATELNLWLQLMAVNHLTMTDTENDDAYDEILLWKNAVDSGDGSGTLVGEKGQVTIDIDSANFVYNYDQDGLRGLNVPASDNDAVWRARSTYGMDDGTGSWLAIYHNDVGGGSIACVLGMSSVYDGTASVGDLTLMIGPEHTVPTVITRTSDTTDADSIINQRKFASDGADIGVAVSPDNLFQYPYRVNNRATEYGSVVDYGGSRGSIRWNKDTVAGTAPSQPADHILSNPVVTEPNAENIDMPKEGFFQHFAVYKAPAGFDRTASYADNKDYLQAGDAYSYLGSNINIAGELGSIAEKRGWGTVLWHDADSRLCNSNNSRDFYGTYIAFLRPATSRGQDLADCAKLSANAFRHII